MPVKSDIKAKCMSENGKIEITYFINPVLYASESNKLSSILLDIISIDSNGTQHINATKSK